MAEPDEERLEIPVAAVFPEKPTAGSLGVVVPENRLEELRELQGEQTFRVWEVRGVISDHVPLSGLGALTRVPRHRLFLNESPLTIYLHRGGRRAVYFDLVAGDDELKVAYIAVRVRTASPSNAFLLAREPLNRLLDVFARAWNMALVYQRLDLMSPRDGGLLAHELVLPPKGERVRLGPLGGFHQAEPFAAYDAILREALTNPSPFYQLLCAWRLYDGTGWIRKFLRQEAQKRNIDAPLPKDPSVDAEELKQMGFTPEFAVGIRKANDLFSKLTDTRNAVAHFLLRGDEGREGHVYLASGAAFQHYSIAATAMLKYSRQALDDLRSYYSDHLETHFMAGTVLPMIERRDQFMVFDPREPR